MEVMLDRFTLEALAHESGGAELPRRRRRSGGLADSAAAIPLISRPNLDEDDP